MFQDQNLFKKKYRTSSTRLPSWNYAGSGSYFITICTKNKEKWFGDIVNDEVVLSEIGKIVEECWQDIPKHFPFVYIDEYVTMPNHVHGILTFDKYDYPKVETQNLASLQHENSFGPQSLNLASVIRGFKIGVTKQSKLIDPTFSWQPRFYEKIIRNEKQKESIRQYIIDNPYNWAADEENIMSM